MILMTKRSNALGLLLTVAMAPVFGWLYAGAWGAVLALLAWLIFYVLPRTTGVRLLGFLYSEFFTPEQLPLTMINITMAIILGTLLFGMGVALYAALVGVPIVVLTLTVVALEPDEEAQSEAAPVSTESKTTRRD
jgi:hypothetical protein